MTEADVRSLMSRAASVIVEDDRYVLVALRLNKSWMRSQLGFLASLIDAALSRAKPIVTGGASPSPSRPIRSSRSE